MLDIRSSRCRRHTVQHVSEPIHRYSPEVSVSEVVRRLRCGGFRGDNKCRARPSCVHLLEVSYHGKSWRKLREVTAMDRADKDGRVAGTQYQKSMQTHAQIGDCRIGRHRV